MNRLFSILGILTIAFTVSNCNKSDDSGGLPLVPPRDSKEVYTENITSIEKYLKNNYMIERNGVISFDSITSANYKNQPTIFEDSRLKSIMMNNDDYTAYTLPDPYDRTKTIFKYAKSADTVKYKMYYLVLNEGEGKKSSPVDSIFVKRTNFTLKNENIASINHPFIGGFYSFPHTVAELKGTVPSPLRIYTGERQMLRFIKTALNSGINPDGTISFDETTAGRIIAFIPSGLGQFNSGYSTLKAYQPYIADLTLISAFERDHDLDGIPSKFEVKKQKKLVLN
ncbi:FKBP-type peptidyl-prolyl cis-trans isomerase FkpA [Myroides gitamensis]|nr:FKBP-type peptidyl-prolyl cis-trans isomerase FkpA [Myroides gitamensis]